MKKSAISCFVENREYSVTPREGFVVFKLITKGHPEFLYEETLFPIISSGEVDEVVKLFTKTTEVVEYNVLARKMANAGEVFLEKVLEVPVKERTSRLHEIYYQE